MDEEQQAPAWPRDSYVDLKGAAAYLSLSPRFLRAKLRSIPHYRVRSKLIFRLSELDQWIAQFREVSVEQPAEGLGDLLSQAQKQAENLISNQGVKADSA
jgi:hypothetical protein